MKIKFLVLSSLVAATVLGFNVKSADACWLCDRRDDVIESGNDAVDTVIDRAETKATICNQTNGWDISYSVGDTSSTLSVGECDSWTSVGRAVVTYKDQNGTPDSLTIGDGTYNFLDSSYDTGTPTIGLFLE